VQAGPGPDQRGQVWQLQQTQCPRIHTRKHAGGEPRRSHCQDCAHQGKPQRPHENRQVRRPEQDVSHHGRDVRRQEFHGPQWRRLQFRQDAHPNFAQARVGGQVGQSRRTKGHHWQHYPRMRHAVYQRGIATRHYHQSTLHTFSHDDCPAQGDAVGQSVDRTGTVWRRHEFYGTGHSLDCRGIAKAGVRELWQRIVVQWHDGGTIGNVDVHRSRVLPTFETHGQRQAT